MEPHPGRCRFYHQGPGVYLSDRPVPHDRGRRDGLFQMAFPHPVVHHLITTGGHSGGHFQTGFRSRAKKDEQRIRSTLVVAILVVSPVPAILFTILILVAAPVIADTPPDRSKRSIYSLMGIAPVIPIMAVSSIFRGYFHGRQHMSPYAVSQMSDTIVRILAVLLFARLLLPLGVEYAAAGP